MTEQEKLHHPNNWRSWGPYVSERQWGTVREDYSAGGDAWNYTTHDMARSKAWRWGEEGIAGISDRNQHVCLALALWNRQDAILKERLFGLSNGQGNHGEDVKEQYYYLDNVPSHSYMKMLYKYPQQPFPYQQLIDENKKRSRKEPEYELLDTGIFDADEYFDVFIEYAKNNEHDLLIQYTIYNRNPHRAATLHLLPTLWFRKLLSWNDKGKRPVLSQTDKAEITLDTKAIGEYYCYADGTPEFLFTENESNNQRLYNAANKTPYVKDGINNYVVNGQPNTINPQKTGTKAALHYVLDVPAGESTVVKMRLLHEQQEAPFDDFDAIFQQQTEAADAFYETLYTSPDAEIRRIQRQAWAGLLWNKQFYHYNVNHWIEGDPGEPPPPEKRREGRNNEWQQMIAADVISMPDKWEYPWFAAWDLAFHCIPLATIDPDFAKEQLLILLEAKFLHPNGELPAYEWNFSDVNPPVHALAAWKVYEADKKRTGKGDIAFLEMMFHKLLLNFTWWVNRKDSAGSNIFEGGFLGLDNIGVFDRSEDLPGGGRLEQSDGTSWMAAYSLEMLVMSCELARHNPVYEEMAIKFGEHFFYIAGAMANMNDTPGEGLWDEEDGFYYDVLRQPDGSWSPLKLRSLVGLIPLIAVEVLREEDMVKLPNFVSHMEWFMQQRPDLEKLVSNWQGTNGETSLHLLSLLRGHRMKALFRRMLDENEFFSGFGIRSLSKAYSEAHPFRFELEDEEKTVCYVPAESETGMFGGNSNWRGPIWFPINYLIIHAMHEFFEYYGDDFKVEMPVGSGQFVTIQEAAQEVARRHTRIFLQDDNGRRPVFGPCEKQQTDPHFKDYLLFYEYFHGDTGKGLGASHQTGWTALVTLLL